MFQDFSKDFQKYKDTSFINLNNGTLGLSPDQVIDQQKFELEVFEKNTSTSLGDSWKRLWSIQEILGAFFNASAKDIFLRPNVSLALNEIIMGLQLPSGSEILTTNFEYGAIVNILKYKTQKEGHSLRIEDVGFLYQDISPEKTIESLLRLTSKKTRAFLISHIFTGSGIQIPLGLLARELKKKNILLIVDGAHAPGLIDLDFQQDLKEVDYYAGNLHKWMMGPKGSAFAWVNPSHQQSTYPLYGSWTTSDNTPSGMDIFKHQSGFAERMLWSHSQNFSSYYGLESCLKFWDHHGKDKIFEEIKKRMDYLEISLSRKGIFNLKGMNSKFRPHFLCYKLDLFTRASFEGLFIKEAGLKLQVGLPRIPTCPVLRLTPHIHNTQSELDSAIELLGRLV